MNALQLLDDEILSLQAQLLGKHLERAYANGDRDTALALQDDMFAVIRERTKHRLTCETADGCYFADSISSPGAACNQ